MARQIKWKVNPSTAITKKMKNITKRIYNMKRIFFTIIAFIAALVTSAQTIKVYEYDDNGNLSSIPAYISSKKVKVIFTDEIEHEYVDLGLPSGTLWATCNVGANSPEEKGLYFAWGETTGYTCDISDGYQFNWENYKWCNGSSTTMTKYCIDSSLGTIDNKTELDPEDDAATVNWGPDWCMPTIDQLNELYNSDNTTTEWVILNGVNGRLITSKKNGKNLFLPIAGYRYHGSLRNAGSNGEYWSRSLNPNISGSACRLYFGSEGFGWDGYGARYVGLSVRPVRIKEMADHEYVDLGLPSGTLWATCNVGAEKPEEYGDYFAWGETVPKDTYNWDTYKWCNSSYNTQTKYCTDSNDGIVDNRTELLPEDDAATANWGSNWCMPTHEQQMELVNPSYTDMEWTTQNGVYGRKITSKKNGKSLFLPAVGYRFNDSLNFAGLDGDGGYWSCSLTTICSYSAYNLLFRSGDVDWYNDNRFVGLSVRPVRK